MILLSFVFASLPKNEPGKPARFITGTLAVQSRDASPLPDNIRPVITVMVITEKKDLLAACSSGQSCFGRYEIYFWSGPKEKNRGKIVTRFFVESPPLGEWNVYFDVSGFDSIDQYKKYLYLFRVTGDRYIRFGEKDIGFKEIKPSKKSKKIPFKVKKLPEKNKV